MATDPQVLVNAAKCYGKCIPPGDQLAALIYLADEILNSPVPPGETIQITGPDGITYGFVTGLDGKVWLDRNLGATQVATAIDDAAAYGDLYQWGRFCDGHQLRTSGTTATPSPTDTPANSLFILQPYNWRSTDNETLWQPDAFINLPCPAGFRIPTAAEWAALVAAESITDSASAFASRLKLTSAGFRSGSSGSIGYPGSIGRYWTEVSAGHNCDFQEFRVTGSQGFYATSVSNAVSIRPIHI